MITAGDFRKGVTIEWEGGVWTIVDFQHVKPGKGGAFVRTKLKDIKTGRVVDYTFNAGTKFDSVRLESKKMQYLYNDGSDYYFMDNDTFEQIFPLIATVLSVGMLQNAMSATGVKGLIGITFITMPVYLIYATVLFVAPVLQGALFFLGRRQRLFFCRLHHAAAFPSASCTASRRPSQVRVAPETRSTSPVWAVSILSSMVRACV